MSHRATTWAFQQRGLKPTTWRVLVQLADRHNRDTGRCDPSQVQLAEDCEISVSTLNVHLEALEERGLIRRVRRSNKATGHQERTYYILGFDIDPAQTPTPESGDGDGVEPTPEIGDGEGAEPTPEIGVSRLRNPETNLGREPGNITAQARGREAEAVLLEAAGSGLCDRSVSIITGTVDVIERWLDSGFDVQADLVPVIRKATKRPRESIIRTWDYFTAAVTAHHARRVARAGRSGSAEKQVAPVAGSDAVEQLARWINSGARVPPSCVSNTKRDALLARGLVTAERLRELQIY